MNFCEIMCIKIKFLSITTQNVMLYRSSGTRQRVLYRVVYAEPDVCLHAFPPACMARNSRQPRRDRFHARLTSERSPSWSKKREASRTKRYIIGRTP